MVDHRQHVVVDDIRMSFGSMVAFMVKAAIASIPAVIILSVVFSAVVMLAMGFMGSPRPLP